MDASASAGAGAGAGADADADDGARMAAIADRLQTRDALRLYNWLAQRCFSDCVGSFYRKALGKREEMCVRSCVHKFLSLSAATGVRFGELADGAAAASDH